jgi:hypothetical protein
MTVHLSLRRAHILRLTGWGKIPDPEKDHFRVEFADVGELAVYRPSLLGEKKLLSMSIEHISLTVGTTQITTGEKWVGGGVGIGGALSGSFQAEVLNSLTRHTNEYTLLTAQPDRSAGRSNEDEASSRLHEHFGRQRLKWAFSHDPLTSPQRVPPDRPRQRRSPVPASGETTDHRTANRRRADTCTPCAPSVCRQIADPLTASSPWAILLSLQLWGSATDRASVSRGAACLARPL